MSQLCWRPAISHQLLPPISHELSAISYRLLPPMSYPLSPSSPGHASYKDLLVWQKSLEFASAVIDLTEKLETDRKHYRLVEQLEAAVTSVPMNIAEGKGRFSRKEFVHFLFIARGSLYETMTLLDIFQLRGWIQNSTYQQLEHQSDEIARMLNGLIHSLEEGNSS
jgi:four helix bundle protein